MIFFTRSYLTRTDSRLHRYFRALDHAGASWHVIAWDRTGQEPDSAQCTHYHRRSPVGGGLRNLGRVLAWNFFCWRELVRQRKRVRVVHAVDLDGGLGAAVFAVMFHRKLIFDAFDRYSDTRNLTGIVGWTCNVLERWCMKRASRVLVPDPCRLQQHDIARWSHVSVIENVPADTAAAQQARQRGLSASSARPMRLVYVGTLEPIHRGLEDLLAVVASRPTLLELTIAGVGPLAEHCQQMAAQYDNIRFLGEVSPDEALQRMGQADVIVGLYYLSSRNHRYAAPNKYYEHLMLGRPLLTTVGTPPGARVAEFGTGWALSEGQSALLAWADSLSEDEVRVLGQRAGARWEATYNHYTRDVLEGHYLGLVGFSSKSATDA